MIPEIRKKIFRDKDSFFENKNSFLKIKIVFRSKSSFSKIKVL